MRPLHPFEHGRLIDEANRKNMRSGRRRESDLLPVIVGIAEIAPSRLAVGVGVEELAPNRQGVDQRTIETHLERVLIGQSANPAVIGPRQIDLDDVVAVDGEDVPYSQTTPRAERQVIADTAV